MKSAVNLNACAVGDIAMQPASLDIWKSKYRLSAKDGAPIDETVDDTYKRVARALADMGFRLISTRGTAAALRHAGVAVEDFNRDGYPDIFATAHRLNDAARYFENDGNGRFVERTEALEPIVEDGWNAFLNSECIWMQLWVELHGEDEVRDYQAFLDAYAESQKALGRFERPLNNRLRDVMEWMEDQEVVQDDVQGNVPGEGGHFDGVVADFFGIDGTCNGVCG